MILSFLEFFLTDHKAYHTNSNQKHILAIKMLEGQHLNNIFLSY